MPFQSEKQRRYLWANEPEIARDWTDTYGSGIAKALGGRIPFYAGSGVASNIFNEPVYDQVAFRPGSMLDREIKQLDVMPDINRSRYDQLRQMDMEQFKEKGIPLSLPEDRYVSNPNYYSDATVVDDNTGINSIPFNQQYLEGSGWLNDARTADEMAQLPIDALPNKRQKLTDFLSRFIPGATVAKMLRPDANEAYGNVAQLYPEEVWGMQEFGSGEDLRTDPWGKNIVSFAGDYEQGIKDWVKKYGSRMPKKAHSYFAKKQAWKKQALAKIIKEEQAREAAREQRKRTEGTNIGGGWTRHDTGGGGATFRGPGGQTHRGYSNTQAGIEKAIAENASFAEGGLAALWQR
jgi:hypothetical protein